GAPENFDDATRRRQTALRKSQELHVDDGAIELVEVRDAAPAQAPLIHTAEAEFLREAGSEFLAGRDFDVLLHARVIRNHDVGTRAGAVAEQTNDSWMCPVKDPQNAPFGPRAR